MVPFKDSNLIRVLKCIHYQITKSILTENNGNRSGERSMFRASFLSNAVSTFKPTLTHVIPKDKKLVSDYVSGGTAESWRTIDVIHRCGVPGGLLKGVGGGSGVRKYFA